MKKQYMNKPFYKFYSVVDSSERTKKTIDYGIINFENDCIYMQSPRKFNDPFDCTFGYTKYDFIKYKLVKAYEEQGLNGNELQQIIKVLCNPVALKKSQSKEPFVFVEHVIKEMCTDDEFAEFQSELQAHEKYFTDLNDRVEETYGVCCFTERMDSHLMWSHYANEHNGFCLEYDFYNHDVDLSNINFAQEMLFPVIYSNKRPQYIELVLNNNAVQNYEKTGHYGKDFIRDILYTMLTKSQEWSYEKEWRIIGANIGDRLIPNIPAKKLYLGARMEDKFKLKLIKIAKKKNIPVYQMALSPDKFKLEWYRID